MPIRITTPRQAHEFLASRVNFERQLAGPVESGDLNLERMRHLLDRLGNPQDRLPAVHLAGTKGKGSTAVMIARVLEAAGVRTALFTSPHLQTFEERLTVNGRPPTGPELASLVDRVAQVTAQLDLLPGQLGPTYFEIATALGWLYFLEQRAELVVLEVGLGGRLDSTNLCRPLVSLITPIGLDHTRQLGETIPAIAREKAGIIRAGVPVVSGALHPGACRVIADTCAERGAPLFQLKRDFDCTWHPGAVATQPGAPPAPDHLDVRWGSREWTRLPLALHGEHQAGNAAQAVVALELLRERGWTIPDSALRAGLRDVRWPGRIEVLSRRPVIILDAAHNVPAIEALAATLTARFPARQRVLLFAASRDKDVAGMLQRILPACDRIVFTEFTRNPRALAADELAQMARAQGRSDCEVIADIHQAWSHARSLATAEDLVCVTGSFFTIGELRPQILADLGVA
ncbi:MAG: bifunctional folylpolyglutamate synthase/dihydrofolate synthase [Planctomycetaceae bacterium]